MPARMIFSSMLWVPVAGPMVQMILVFLICNHYHIITEAADKKFTGKSFEESLVPEARIQLTHPLSVQKASIQYAGLLSILKYSSRIFCY